jgi:hypothetical protein
MPLYRINIQTDAVLDRDGLDSLEDVVYDALVSHHGASVETVQDGGGVTDVEAEYL